MLTILIIVLLVLLLTGGMGLQPPRAASHLTHRPHVYRWSPRASIPQDARAAGTAAVCNNSYREPSSGS